MCKKCEEIKRLIKEAQQGGQIPDDEAVGEAKVLSYIMMELEIGW